MKKRERENPCGICGHYHKYEEGEVCGVCGHLKAADSSATSVAHAGAFATEILPDFLYLGSYDNAARAEILKTQGISRVLNVVPACQNLYKNSFTYHCLQYNQTLPFDDAFQFLEQCERERAKVLVHCMTGKNRSPAVVMAYLMKSKGWRLAQSYQWVKERRSMIELNQGIYQQLQEYEQTIFGSCETSGIAMSNFPPISFGFLKPTDPPIPLPAFNDTSSSSIFSRAPFEVPPQGFIFGASQPLQKNSSEATMNTAVLNDIAMDGS